MPSPTRRLHIVFIHSHLFISYLRQEMRSHNTNLYWWIFINWIFRFQTWTFKSIEFSNELSHQSKQRLIEFNLLSFLHIREVLNARTISYLIIIIIIIILVANSIQTWNIIIILVIFIRRCILFSLKWVEYLLDRIIIRMHWLIILMDAFDFFSLIVVDNWMIRHIFHFSFESLSFPRSYYSLFIG